QLRARVRSHLRSTRTRRAADETAGVVSSDVVRALETESDAVLRQRHGDELPGLILAALRAGSFSSFEGGFELAARCCTPATVSEAVAWADRYIASGRGVPDAVPWWDVASRQWLVKL